MPDSRPTRVTKVLARLCLLMLACLVLLGSLEVGARCYIRFVAERQTRIKLLTLQELAQRRFGLIREPHRYIGYTPSRNYDRPPNRHNAMGYRGDDILLPKPEGEYRIVCLGGSTTYTSEVADHRLAFPAQLENVLQGRGHDVTVVNAGMPGYTSWETLAMFQTRVLDLDPDLIVVYHGFNDIAARLVWPPEAYRGDNSGYRTPNTLIAQSEWGEFVSHSAFVRYVYFAATGRSLTDRLFGDYTVQSTSLLDELRQQVKAGTFPSGVFAPDGGAEVLRRNPPIYFERNLRNLVASARSHDVDVLLATQVLNPEVEDLVGSVAIPLMVNALAEHTDVVRDLAARTEVELYDFATQFPARPELHADPLHFNEEGASLKARMFADEIEQRFLPSNRTASGN